MKDKKYRKVRDNCHYTGEYRGAAHSICNLKHSVPKRIPIRIHFIMKELAEEFKKQFTCLGENLWQAHYQILLIIFLKEFIEINLN